MNYLLNMILPNKLRLAQTAIYVQLYQEGRKMLQKVGLFGANLFFKKGFYCKSNSTNNALKESIQINWTFLALGTHFYLFFFLLLFKTVFFAGPDIRWNVFYNMRSGKILF